jgi:hypothetical protein
MLDLKNRMVSTSRMCWTQNNLEKKNRNRRSLIELGIKFQFSSHLFLPNELLSLYNGHGLNSHSPLQARVALTVFLPASAHPWHQIYTPILLCGWTSADVPLPFDDTCSQAVAFGNCWRRASESSHVDNALSDQRTRTWSTGASSRMIECRFSTWRGNCKATVSSGKVALT